MEGDGGRVSDKQIENIVQGLKEALNCDGVRCSICKDWIETAISFLEEIIEEEAE